MRSRTFILVAVFIAILLAASVGVYAYDHSREHTIAKGVTVASVPIGGLDVARAKHRLHRRLTKRLARPIVVTYAGKRYVLTAEQARLHTDLAATVDEALQRSRNGNIISRTARNLRGGSLDINLEPHISYSNKAVEALVERVGGAVHQPVQEADVSFDGASVDVKRGHDGADLKTGRLRSAVQAALTATSAPHRIAAHARKVKPTRTTAEVAKKYPIVLTLDRANFRLNVFKKLKLAKSYTVAVGQQGLETPAGLYHIQNKAVDPSWHVPTSAWAGSLGGTVVPPGPDNPIKARWMGIFDGAGIHGTDETYSLGQAASHGCVRMAIPDVIELYPQVPVGAPIYIA